MAKGILFLPPQSFCAPGNGGSANHHARPRPGGLPRAWQCESDRSDGCRNGGADPVACLAIYDMIKAVERAVRVALSWLNAGPFTPDW